MPVILLRNADASGWGWGTNLHITSLSEGCQHPRAKHGILDMGDFNHFEGIPRCEINQDVVGLGWFGFWGTGNFMLRRWTTGELLMVSGYPILFS